MLRAELLRYGGAYVIRDETGRVRAELCPDGTGWWFCRRNDDHDRLLYEPYTPEEVNQAAVKVAHRLFPQPPATGSEGARPSVARPMGEER